MPSAGPTAPSVHFCEPSATKAMSQDGQRSSFAVMIAPQAAQRLRLRAGVRDGVTFSLGWESGSGCCVSWQNSSSVRWRTSPWGSSESAPRPLRRNTAQMTRMMPVTTMVEKIAFISKIAPEKPAKGIFLSRLLLHHHSPAIRLSSTLFCDAPKP